METCTGWARCLDETETKAACWNQRVDQRTSFAAQAVRLSAVADADVILLVVAGVQRVALVAFTAWVGRARGDGRFAAFAGPRASARAFVRRRAGLVALAVVHAWLFAFADRFGVLDLFALIGNGVVDETGRAIHHFVGLFVQARDVLAGVAWVGNVALRRLASAERN